MSEIDRWVQAATQAAASGRWNEAEQAWRRVLALEPRHVPALYSLGVHAFQRGQLVEALSALHAARAIAPHEPAVAVSIARVLREQGNIEGERQAIEEALAADAYFLPALLGKAEWLERFGEVKAAVEVYRNALKVAPDEATWPAGQKAQLRYGRELVTRFGEAMAKHLEDRLGARMDSLNAFEAQRCREAGALIAGTTKVYPSLASQLQIPRLPAIPFFERSSFPWVESLEARTGEIGAELRSVLESDEAEFHPYVAYVPGVPVNQWRELNHSKRWSGYKLWDNGMPQQEHLARCPNTAEALSAVEQADINGMCPNAMFSVLAPRTHIPPHTGDTNARLVVHLPLIVPDGCGYRVGFERRSWKVGEVLIFDDSIEHEARNDSDELRVVLIFDVWNPLLSEGEREMVRALTIARREFEFG